MKAHLDCLKKRLRIIIVLLLILVLTVIISGCEKQLKSNSVICNLEDYSTYPNVVEQILPDFKIEQSENKVYYSLDDGSIAEAFDTQALGALETGIAKYWYPQYLATVIIAVDRNQTDVKITSWNDLFDNQFEVSFFDNAGNAQMLAAAMSYGLEGENYTLTKAMELLALLHKNKLLKMNTFEAPVIICYDYQAAILIGEGRNFEIIVPSEGTFTYEKGLLSNEKLKFEGNINKVLVESKLRLLDGQSGFSIYPNEKNYANAVKIVDYNHFAKITQNVSCLIQRDVLNSKRFMSIDNREHLHFALVYIILVTIWVASFLRRSMQKGVSYAAFFTGILLNGWTLVRLIKYQNDAVPTLTRYLWYSFYIFQLLLPLVMLWMAWAIDKPENEILPPRWWRFMAVIVGVLIIFVFTNDLHGLVFRLDLTRADWGKNYTYGLGYYLVLIISAINLIGVLVLLVLKSIRNPRKMGFVFPFAILFMFCIYTYKYIMRDSFVYETDITMITGFFTMLMFESCIRSGLIPVNTKYIALFKHSPLKIQIINKEGEIVLSSVPSQPLNKDILYNAILTSPVPVLEEDDSLIFTSPIPGGYVIWHEDISKLNQLKMEIEKSMQMLKEANAILSEEEKINRFINEENAKKQLMEQLEAEIAGNTEQLSAMIENLPNAENNSKETTRIALLLCYIKRRCNLFFQEKETNILGADTLIIYIDELSEIAKYYDIQIASINEINENLSIRYATLFYDFFYEIVDLAVQRDCPFIIEHLGIEEKFIIMRFLPSVDIGIFKPDERLIAAIESSNGKYLIKDLDDTIGISISFPKGGVAND